MKRSSFSLLIYTAMILTALPVNFFPADAASRKVIIDILSGRPNPVITLTDSSSIALIDNRIGCYLIISRSGDPGAPSPLSNLGYRGVLVDYNREFEKMVLRFCRRASQSSPSADSEKIMTLIPDSLSKEYTETGFFTLEENSSVFGNPAYVDISLLGSGYHYFSKMQDTAIASDITITRGSGVYLILQSPLGIYDAGTLPGFPQFNGTTMMGDYSSLMETYRSVLFLSKTNPPRSGYQQSLSLTKELQTGRLFIIKTNEGGYAALVFVGSYMGGIDRSHFYYYYTTDSVFTQGSTTAAKMIPANKNHTVSANVRGDNSLSNNLMINLKGQRVINLKAISSQKLPRQIMLRSCIGN